MQLRMRRSGAVAALAALAMLASACGGGAGGDEGPAAPSASEPGSEEGSGEAAASDVSFTLKSGTIVPLTGDQSSLGPGYGESTRIAVEMINESLERLGLDGQISMELTGVEDDQTEARAGVEAATKLVQVDGVQVIFGSVASAVTIPIAESVTIPNEVVLISMGSTSPAITDLADNGFVWRTVPSAGSQGVALADVVEQELGPDAVINTGARNDDFAISLIDLFEKEWTDRGYTLGEKVRWNPDAPTFDTEAQQLASGDPDGWVVIDFPEGWGRMGPALVRTGQWDPKLTFTAQSLQTVDLPEIAGTDATEGMRGVSPASEEAEMFDEFVQIFDERAEPGTTREGFAPYAFDAPFLAILAALQGGSADPATIRDNLQSVSGPPGQVYTYAQLDEAITAVLAGEDIDYEGAGGPTDFDDNGDPGKANFQTWGFVDGEIEVFEVLQ